MNHMSEQDIRFHLQPISERYSLDELRQRECTYLQNNRCDLGLPPPRSGLRLVIAIPAFNEEDAISEVLRSLCSQSLSHERSEVIVVDNGSTDDTRSVVLKFASHCDLPIHLIAEPIRGFLQALRTGMDVALHRLAQVSSPREGIIATIDADDRVGPHWARTVIETITERKADMLRGPTQVAPPLSPEVELCVKALCDIENRVNGYVELARLRLKEALLGVGRCSRPLWLPRITGPNIAINRAAYVAVGGLDPRPPGDRASRLANPLFRMGGIVMLCDDPRMTLFRSRRPSHRSVNQGAGFGVEGFGDMLERAAKAVEEKGRINYPNPARTETGLQRILAGLQSRARKEQKRAKKWATRFLDSPPDPNLLYRYGDSPGEPAYIPIAEAKAILIEMTTRADGVDYRIAERFLMGRELLRRQVLTYEGQWVHSDRIVDAVLKRMGFSLADIPRHVRQMATALKKIPNAEKEKWYDAACRALEEIYAQITPP